MRAWCLLLLAALAGRAQFPAPEQGGIVLECDSNTDTGEFAIRAPDNQVYRFRFDAKTTVERDTFSGGASWLRSGDKISVQSEPVEGSLLRYARAVQVLNSPHPLALANSRLSSLNYPLLDFAPHTSTLTFAGVVASFTSESLVLRTRAGRQTLLIRHDTRYVDNGDTVEAGKLKPNMRVFVRAGRNLDEQVEAYQVIWGEILEPPQK